MYICLSLVGRLEVPTTPVTTTSKPELPQATPLIPKEGLPLYVYYIIAGIVGGVALVLVLVGVVFCICCCHRRWRSKHQGTWVSSSSAHHRSHTHQNSYVHNGAVGDMSQLGKEKEEGFDDPKDTIKVTPPPDHTYSPAHHHDVILHALNHSLDDGERYVVTPKATTTAAATKVGGHQRNGYRVHHGSNGVIVGGQPHQANGRVRVQHQRSESSPETEIPQCPPPDYNELFKPEVVVVTSNGHVTATPNGHVTATRVNGHMTATPNGRMPNGHVTATPNGRMAATANGHVTAGRHGKASYEGTEDKV